MRPSSLFSESGIDVTDDAVLETFNSIAIPACPTVILRLVDAIREDATDLKTLAQLIATDVGLAASVLRLANSPFFRLPSKARTIHAAVSVLGLRNLVRIAYNVTLHQSLGRSNSAAMHRFWNRSAYKPIAAASLASLLATKSVDNAYTFGLFCDAGIPVLMQRFANYKETLRLANRSVDCFTSAEDARHNINHALVGAMLAWQWHLPSAVYRAIGHHHDVRIFDVDAPSDDDALIDLVALGILADFIVSRFLATEHDAEWHRVAPLAIGRFGITYPQLEELHQTILPELEDARQYRG